MSFEKEYQTEILTELLHDVGKIMVEILWVRRYNCFKHQYSCCSTGAIILR